MDDSRRSRFANLAQPELYDLSIPDVLALFASRLPDELRDDVLLRQLEPSASGADARMSPNLPACWSARIDRLLENGDMRDVRGQKLRELSTRVLAWFAMKVCFGEQAAQLLLQAWIRETEYRALESGEDEPDAVIEDDESDEGKRARKSLEDLLAEEAEKGAEAEKATTLTGTARAFLGFCQACGGLRAHRVACPKERLTRKFVPARGDTCWTCGALALTFHEFTGPASLDYYARCQSCGTSFGAT